MKVLGKCLLSGRRVSRDMSFWPWPPYWSTFLKAPWENVGEIIWELWKRGNDGFGKVPSVREMSFLKHLCLSTGVKQAGLCKKGELVTILFTVNLTKFDELDYFSSFNKRSPNSIQSDPRPLERIIRHFWNKFTPQQASVRSRYDSLLTEKNYQKNFFEQKWLK